MKRRHKLLVFQDAIGITEGYKTIWERLLAKCGITTMNTHVILRTSYTTFPRKQHLEWKKTRKQPGFNTDPVMQRRVTKWVMECIAHHKPDLIVCFDPALLFLLNPDWSQATLDRLRGGLYIQFDIPWVVTLPLTAYHTKAKSTDIAKLNQGFVEKGDFNDYKQTLDFDADGNLLDDSVDGDERDIDQENEDSRMEWHEPITIPYGKLVLKWDFEKVARLLSRIPVEDLDYSSVKLGE